MYPGVSSCSHSGSDLCPIGTPVSLGATVWYEDNEGNKAVKRSSSTSIITPRVTGG